MDLTFVIEVSESELAENVDVVSFPIRAVVFRLTLTESSALSLCLSGGAEVSKIKDQTDNLQQKAAVASTINHFRQSFGPFKVFIPIFIHY